MWSKYRQVHRFAHHSKLRYIICYLTVLIDHVEYFLFFPWYHTSYYSIIFEVIVNILCSISSYIRLLSHVIERLCRKLLPYFKWPDGTYASYARHSFLCKRCEKKLENVIFLASLSIHYFIQTEWANEKEEYILANNILNCSSLVYKLKSAHQLIDKNLATWSNASIYMRAFIHKRHCLKELFCGQFANRINKNFYRKFIRALRYCAYLYRLLPLHETG